MRKYLLISALFFTFSSVSAQITVTDFLPQNYVTDGSVNYSKEIQQAMDKAGELKSTVVFPAMLYLVNEIGLTLRSGITLSMYGATFIIDKNSATDGQVFQGTDISDLNMFGGEIAGGKSKWPDGVNIRGVYLKGNSQNIRIRDMFIHDISSNGIGIFGEDNLPAQNVWVQDIVIDKGCNFYGDYMSERPGTEAGSVREDQGLIALYFVNNFVVRGCRFENSRSDGTHFYRCKQGQIIGNKIYNAQMGGFFLETCENVLGAENIMRDNGSRGTTIERGSKNCIFSGNVVENSGREGLWAPDCIGLVVTDNIFRYNGRKPNDMVRNRIWNANMTIDEASDPTQSPTTDYLIQNNIFYTSESQIAAIRIDADVSDHIFVKNNMFRGEKLDVLVQGKTEGKKIQY
ncbi:right-handed parallel beta-helix repeat-containing protein [candidate division KSB1 bacterium]|nr:right-handed parallel beta-helix repeat-containing protein [candidate division KSB1 bacterium]